MGCKCRIFFLNVQLLLFYFGHKLIGVNKESFVRGGSDQLPVGVSGLNLQCVFAALGLYQSGGHVDVAADARGAQVLHIHFDADGGLPIRQASDGLHGCVFHHGDECRSGENLQRARPHCGGRHVCTYGECLCSFCVHVGKDNIFPVKQPKLFLLPEWC